MTTNRIKPPKSWGDLNTHYTHTFNSVWYKNLLYFQNEFNYATVEFYRNKRYIAMQLPITTGSVSSPMGLGSDSLPVKVNISGMDIYLTDSAQFFLEYAYRLVKTGVYYIAPSFRGEIADSRHLCQFYHSEAEVFGNLDTVINLCEDYLVHLVKHFLKNNEKEIENTAGTIDHLTKFLNIMKAGHIQRCNFDEAVKILKNNTRYVEAHGKYRVINSEGEKALMDYFNGFVWLTHFDHLAVPFYQQFDPSNTAKAVNADLLLGIGETIGAGERHYKGEQVLKALKLHHIEPQKYDWYIKIKERVPAQTSGFGLGVERFFLWLLKQKDIRDMQLIPRFNGIESAF